LLSHEVTFDTPDAFDEFFEPIEICGMFSSRNERFKAVSGEEPTREERDAPILKLLNYCVRSLLVVVLVYSRLMGLPRIVQLNADRMLMAMAFVVAGAYGVHLVIRAQARLYLVPGGVAVVRGAIRRFRSARISVHSRMNTCLVFRKVGRNLMMELWPPEGKIVRRPISEREAISVIATWP